MVGEYHGGRTPSEPPFQDVKQFRFSGMGFASLHIGGAKTELAGLNMIDM